MPSGVFTLKQVEQAIGQGAWTNQPPISVNYLVVAGGGAGGAVYGGGGGAGGLLQGSLGVPAGTSITVTVGAGGSTTGASGNSGNSSVFSSISATGGGGGSSNANNGSSGGSGGGGGYLIRTSGIAGQGNGGGASTFGGNGYGGGGGGAGTIGASFIGTGSVGVSYGGYGGAGIASDISGTRTAYAGGGGGGTLDGAGVSGVGGSGGGGNGGNSSVAAVAGSGNTGGGGGGGYNGAGGNGGSGIVIVSYPGTTQWFTGGTLSYGNGNIVHSFYSSGTLAPTTPSTYVDTGYQISRSLRFNKPDAATLTRTPASASNQKTWTWSGWIKRGRLGIDTWLFSSGTNGANVTLIRFKSDDTLRIYTYDSSTSSSQFIDTTAVFRDPSAWYHIVGVHDTTQAVAADRVKLYVNGVQQVGTAVGTVPQNSNGVVNSTNQHFFGPTSIYAGAEFDGYMTEVNFIDGQALTPQSFGYYNPDTGVWSPLKFVGTYGTNGFYLNFSDNSNTTAATLGKDYSGNGNNWTPNNFSVSAGAGNDSLVDTPTPYGLADTGVGGEVRGNYATWNPLVVNKPTLTNGNLDADGSDLKTAISTMGVSSGKWYWEITIGSGTNTPNMGVTSFANDNADPGVYLGVGRSYVSSGGGSGVYKNYTATSTVADSDFSNANTAGAVIGFALDCDVGTLTYYVNNVLGHIDTTIAAGTVLYPMTCNFNSGASNYRNTSVNFGQRPFAYTAPAGFRALTTWNLPTPAIGATSTTQAGKYFNPVLYTGNGNATAQAITGTGFQPDWVWIKSRSNSYVNLLFDAVRGAGKQLISELTNAETTVANFVSFDSDGFTVNANGGASSYNANGATYVAWQWKANGAGSSNTAGSITSTVSANTTSGFSIVTWTGNGAEVTVGHGLGAVPSLIIHKFRSAISNWSVYTATTGAGKRLKLNSTDAVATDGSFPVAPTSTVFSINAGSNDNGVTMLAYCFAEVPGFSKIGSYTGNGSADGPFVFTGMRPAFVMLKNTTTAGNAWHMIDTARGTYNVYGPSLDANASSAEITYTICDLLSNGFKLRDTNQAWNKSGDVYIFMAFASNPFKYSLAR